MKTLDPSIRQAAQRVTAWHIARWQAHNEAMDSALPATDADTTPADDPQAPQETAPVHEPARVPARQAGLAS